MDDPQAYRLVTRALLPATGAALMASHALLNAVADAVVVADVHDVWIGWSHGGRLFSV